MSYYQQGLNHIWHGRTENPEFAADDVISSGRCEELTAEEREALRSGLVESAERYIARLEEDV